MSTTVTYEGSTIATVDNNTKTLQTAGKYLTDNITLVDVSQSGGGHDGCIEVKTDANGYVTEYACHMDTIPPFLLDYTGWTKTSAPFPTVSFPVKPTHIGGYAFHNFKGTLDWSGLSEVETADSEYTLVPAYSSKCNGTNDIISLPSFVGYVAGHTAVNIFRTTSTYAPKTFNLPVVAVVPQNAWYGYKMADISITIGSIGHPVTGSRTQPFGGTSRASGTVTIYTTGANLDTLKTDVQNGAGSNITFVYKAAEATTYGGNSYAEGDTILTV